jgi:tyrosyl-tRNA synthetase
VEEAKASLQKGEHPMTIKKELAFQIVEELYGLKKAEQAKLAFASRVQKKELPADIPTVAITYSEIKSAAIVDILVKNKLLESKAAAKRLIAQGGLVINDTVINDPNKTINSLMKNNEAFVKIGKRKFVRIVNA